MERIGRDPQSTDTSDEIPFEKVPVPGRPLKVRWKVDPGELVVWGFILFMVFMLFKFLWESWTS